MFIKEPKHNNCVLSIWPKHFDTPKKLYLKYTVTAYGLIFFLLPRNFNVVVLLVKGVAHFTDSHEFSIENFQNILFCVKFIKSRFKKFSLSRLEKIISKRH